MPDAMFFYYDVVPSEIAGVGQTCWFGQTRGVFYLGTTEIVDELAAKQVLPA
jgi:hypothetical protein